MKGQRGWEDTTEYTSVLRGFFLAMRWTRLIPRFTRTDNNVIADTLQAQVEKADKIIRATDRSELHGTKSYTCVLYVYG